MTKQQRLVLWIAILATFVSGLDGSIVNVALPAISASLHGGLALQQWVVDAYLITLGSLMLIAGSFSDLFGRKRMLQVGLIGFGITSFLCAIAPGGDFLIAARALQGVAGALLVPSSLALIIAVFSGPAQGKAIGSWTAWTGISYLIGPLLGGFLIEGLNWRYIFAINLIPIPIALWILSRLQLGDEHQKHVSLDVRGAISGAVGLGGTVYALIEQGHYGWSSPSIYLPLIVGMLSTTYFIWYEQRVKNPMLPPGLFRAHNFSVGNVATVAIYAGLSISTFLITIFIQQYGGYSAIQAGLALMPVTLIMFVLSSRFGELSARFGPRLFMGLGPIIGGLGFLYMLHVDKAVHYWTQMFPGVLLFGLGLSITVAPLTAAILGCISPTQAGIGSAVNNALSRIAGLLAIAAVGLVTGPGPLTLAGFHHGVIFMSLLLFVGGAISLLGIQNNPTRQETTIHTI